MGSFLPKPRSPPRAVCIIGAGPSGLAAAKYLLAEETFSRITIFEQRDNVGGIWNHVPCPPNAPRDLTVPQLKATLGPDRPIWQASSGKEKHNGRLGGLQFMSPLYDRLETNIPRGLMGFSDLKWSEDCQLFPGHEEVLRYIERYAEDVRHLVQFRTQVLDVRLADEDRWKVTTKILDEHDERGQPKEAVFDAVVVANGHFNTPFIPQVQGIERWNEAYPGSISHSKLFRRPEEYTRKKVVIVGNSASGIDIGGQVMTACKHPLLVSQKSESYLQPDPSPTKVEKPEIVEYIVDNRSVRFADGSVESDIDNVLYCTGYFYSYPFLSSLDPPLVTTGEHVHNLYQHIFYRPHPTLVLPVLNQKVIPFPLAEAQSAVIARVFSGRLDLPTPAEMAAWEEETQKETDGGRMLHVLFFPKDAEYINMLHDWAVTARPGTGKEPPVWGEKEWWTRERFPAIKKAFQSLGDERHSRRTLESVGFDFAEWKNGSERAP